LEGHYRQSDLAVKRKILVVDDDRSILLTLKAMLTPFGFAIDLYQDPVSALGDFKRGSYDLLILDVSMPKMSGFELYLHLKQIDDAVRVCFLTAMDDFSEFQEYRKEAAPKANERYFVPKPVTGEDLLERVGFMTSNLGNSGSII